MAVRLKPGDSLNQYRILQHLDSGGMGEVYVAEDPRLNRKVAVKVLPEDCAQDDASRQRFLQEARAASALNHPNITTVHDISFGSAPEFLVMEYVEGDSLRAILARGKPELRQALEYAAQAASGLAAAHTAGVVHRDIKPGNLMIAPGGRVKILDFGLAKLAARGPSSELETVSGLQTTPGAILGTIAYMSPEQAAGAEADCRSDIFSLGLVLYEMLTGRRAFEGKSNVDTLHAILHGEISAADRWNPSLPPQSLDILAKALSRDPAERYHHAADLEIDLRRLKRWIDAKPESPAARAVRTHRVRWLAATAAVALAALATGWWLARRQGAIHTLAQVSLARLTSDPGYEGEPTFSPDGQTIAYVSDRSGNFDIYLKQITGGPDVNITNHPADDIQPSFSPDGRQIAFVSARSGAELHWSGVDGPVVGGDIFVVPALGGAPRKIARGNFPSWSPDGRELLFTAGARFRSKLYRVAAAGGDPVEIPLQFSEQRAPAHLMHPGLSPNGKWVALDDGVAVYTASVAGGNARNLGKGMYPVWSPSGGFLVYSSTEPGKNGSLWEVPVENRTGSTSGPGRPLTVGRGIDSSPSLSKDGSAIAFAAMDRTFNLEEVAFDESAGWVTGPPQSITRGSEVTYFFGQSHDGRSFFYVRRLGTQEGLWRIDRGGSPTQIGADAPLDGGAPRVSPDGASVLYNSRGSIWMMSADGSNPREIVPNAGARSWLPNGREVLYFSNKDRQYKIMDLASKAVRAVSQDPNLIQIHCISADGKWLVTQTSERGNIDLRAIPLDGGPSRVVVATPQEDYHPSMATDGRWLYFHRDHKNIWRVPGPAQNWRPVEPVRVTDFAESGLYVEDPQISADGKRLVYSRGHVTADLWVLRLPQ